MKEIKAYIKKHKVDAVIFALSKIPTLTGLSTVEVNGFGRGRGKTAGSRLAAFEERLFDAPSIKLEVVCRDELVEEIIAAIVHNAHTGLRGDGKIYVSPVENAVRISTGERGQEAV